MPSDCVPVHGHDLYIERHGAPDRPVVILLHHGLGAVQAWEAQVPALVDAGLQVLAYDRWGYGRSQARVEFSMPTFRDDLNDLAFILEYYDFDRVSLIGHSDGGTIALYYAAEHPDQIVRLVTVAAHIYVEPKMKSGIDETRLAYEQNERFRIGLSKLHGENADRVLYGWYSGWRGPENLQWDMRSTLARVDCPVLVVQGDADEHATPQHARDLANALLEAKLWLAPGVGHMLDQEYPEAFNRRVLAFLQS